MLEATNGECPKYFIWENVQGALSSHKGEDFNVVLSTIFRELFSTDLDAQGRPKKWPKMGIADSPRGSLAWRVLDAQFWGVPQRRLRLFLIGCIGRGSAAKILFDSPCSTRHFGPMQEKGPKDSTSFRRSLETPKWCFDNHSQDARYNGPLEVAPTLTAQLGTGGNNQPLVVWDASKGDYDGALAVRRLTPKECGRLQGFPDGWTDGLAIEDPTEEQLNHWVQIFTTKATLEGKKPKTPKQVLKWLKSPNTLTSEYTMWGNGVALPCVFYILDGIVKYHLEKREESK